jgi:tRNA (guanine-N7-)-methyltransferase
VPKGDPTSPGHLPDRQFYGRHKGHPLRPQQLRRYEAMLPQLALDLTQPPPARLCELFTVPVGEVWLEIGFGGGEHLAWQAAHNPEVGIIGVEPFLNGMSSLIGMIEDANLANVRVHDREARTILPWLPAASLARAFILFPDPWPKRRHRRRRVVSPDNMRMLAAAMAPGAELRIGTDIGDYAMTSLLAVLDTGCFDWPAAAPQDWRQRPQDWPETRYERKALDAGRRCYYLRFKRR